MTLNDAREGAKTLASKLDKADTKNISLKSIQAIVESAYPHIKSTEQFQLSVILRELLKEKWDLS